MIYLLFDNDDFLFLDMFDIYRTTEGNDSYESKDNTVVMRNVLKLFVWIMITYNFNTFYYEYT